ncbi:MAG: hypothetical protein EBU84_16575, partial [Actinobacteria bacterium]|nr:hypothetical protein [Actinomycetota bacterium]
FERNTMLKTLKRKIALVAVAGLGFGLVSTVPANAALTVAAIETTFVYAGSTSAVTANAGVMNDAGAAGADSLYLRTGVNSLILGMTAATDGDVVYISMVSGATAPTADAAGKASIVDLGCADLAGADASGDTAGDIDVDAGGAQTATTDTACEVTIDGTSFSGLTLTTPSLTAGTYSIWADSDKNSNAGIYKIATVNVYNVGAPRTIAIDKKVTQVGALADVTYKYSLKDSVGRSTFLVGDEQIISSMDTLPPTC